MSLGPIVFPDLWGCGRRTVVQGRGLVHRTVDCLPLPGHAHRTIVLDQTFSPKREEITAFSHFRNMHEWNWGCRSALWAVPSTWTPVRKNEDGRLKHLQRFKRLTPSVMFALVRLILKSLSSGYQRLGDGPKGIRDFQRLDLVVHISYSLRSCRSYEKTSTKPRTCRH